MRKEILVEDGLGKFDTIILGGIARSTTATNIVQGDLLMKRTQ